MEYVAVWLYIPRSKMSEIKQKNLNKREHCRVIATYYIDHVPGASWLGVANALWISEDYAPLEVVQRLYLRGKTCGWYIGVQLHWLPWQQDLISGMTYL